MEAACKMLQVGVPGLTTEHSQPFRRLVASGTASCWISVHGPAVSCQASAAESP